MSERRMNTTDGLVKAQLLLDNGYDESYVHGKLVKEGFSEPEADDILARLRNASKARKSKSLGDLSGYGQASSKLKNDFRNREYQSSSYENYSGEGMNNDFVIGLAIMLIGCAITFFSYTAAANNPGGGTYVIAWGAVVFGFIRMIKGLSQQ